jgi:hypothetical protein
VDPNTLETNPMAKKNEAVGAEFRLDLIQTIDDNERAALDAIRRFVGKVDKTIPGAGKKGAPRRQLEAVEAGLNMIEQMLTVSNEVAQRVIESVREALPGTKGNAKPAKQTATPPAAAVSPSTVDLPGANKAAAPKKAAPKKAAPKKAAAKKAAPKKAAPKKAATKKAATKKAATKKAAPKKAAPK